VAPTTLIGVAILIVLLGPGFCYVAATERRFTAHKKSAFRETVQIAAASIILDLLVLAPFWLARTFWSSGTPDIGALVSKPHTYWLNHYRLVAGWGLALFIAACMIGFLAGTFIRPAKSLRASAWVGMFEVFPKDQKWIGLELQDGSFLSGQLYSYSLDPEETDDRELVLRDPEYRAPGMKNLVPLGSALTVVSAREIRFLSVNYTPVAPRPDREPFRERIALAFKVLQGKARSAALEIIEPGIPVPGTSEIGESSTTS
jgi:hypothetical protein